MPVRSYHNYSYFLTIFDNATSHDWTVNLKQKSDAAPAIQQFIAMYGQNSIWPFDQRGTD